MDDSKDKKQGGVKDVKELPYHIEIFSRNAKPG